MARAQPAKEAPLEIEPVDARVKHDLADELSAADLVALNERADQTLAELWNNPKDAACDDKSSTRRGPEGRTQSLQHFC